MSDKIAAAVQAESQKVVTLSCVGGPLDGQPREGETKAVFEVDGHRYVRRGESHYQYVGQHVGQAGG